MPGDKKAKYLLAFSIVFGLLILSVKKGAVSCAYASYFD